MRRSGKSDKATLLILGARLSQIPAINAAQRMGLKVIAVDPDPAAPGMTLATFAYPYDLADLEAILDLGHRHAIDGVMTLAADYPMPTVAAVCQELHLPGPTTEAVAKATNKRLMRIALAAAGVPCPTFIHADTLEQARPALQQLHCDAVFKPAMSQGGRGITRVPMDASDDEIAQAFHRALAETRSDGAMIESLIEGPEFSVETLTYDGVTHVIAVTDKTTSGPPYFVEMGHNQPSRWPTEQVKLLSETARQAVQALGIEQTAAHTEIRLSPHGPVVMEVAARLGGGFINSHLVPLSTGIDIVSAAIQLAIGKIPDIRPQRPGRAAAIRFLDAPPGVVTGILGLEAANRCQGVEEAQIYVKPGDTVRQLLDASARLGHVICSAADPALAISAAEHAAGQIHIATVTTPAGGS